LISKGADPARMFFFNVLSCPEGIAKVTAAYPGARSLLGPAFRVLILMSMQLFALSLVQLIAT
jgi:hypothetical protein